jgi:hypothetical protein
MAWRIACHVLMVDDALRDCGLTITSRHEPLGGPASRRGCID